MLNQPQSPVMVGRLNDEGVDESLGIRAILETCKFLPTVVGQARLTSVVERVQGLLDAWTSDSACPDSTSDWHGHSKRRDENSPFTWRLSFDTSLVLNFFVVDSDEAAGLASRSTPSATS